MAARKKTSEEAAVVVEEVAVVTVVEAPPETFESQLKAFDISEEAIQKLKDEELTTIEQLGAFDYEKLKALGIKAGSAQKIVEAFASAPPSVTPNNPLSLAGSMKAPVMADNVLPVPPDDTSFLRMLQTGGILKVGEAEVISAVKAGLAAKFGLFDSPKIIRNAMLAKAEGLGDPIGEIYIELKKLIKARSYADVLSVVDVSGADYVNETSKRKLFERIDSYLWPAMMEFRAGVKSWMEASNNSASSGLVIATAFTSFATGQVSPALQAMQQLDVSPIRDLASSTINKINTTFAGEGIIISRALAHDVGKIRKILDKPELPATIGAKNLQDMLLQLGINVDATDVRLERNIVRYALGIMELPNARPEEEMAYVFAMFQVGEAIPWDRLAKKTVYKTGGSVVRDDAGFSDSDDQS